MSYSYSDILDRLPLPTESAFYDAIESVGSAWAAACPLERAQRFHFASNGDDAAGDGSEAAPWRSIAKANAVAGPDTALLFRRGDVWRTVETLQLKGAAASAWGDRRLPMPRITAFTLLVAGSAFAAASGGRYTAELPSSAWMLKRVEQHFALYKRAASAAQVEATEGSYWIDGDTLHLRDFDGQSPLDHEWELTPTGQSNNDGIRLDAHGSRAESLWVDGQGMDGSLTQEWAFRSTLRGDEVAAVTNCVGLYNPRHNIGQLTSAGSGGRMLIEGCVFGGVIESEGIPCVSYAANGLNEMIALRSACPVGRIPMTVGQAGAEGRMFYAHAGTGAANRVGLQAALDCRATQWSGYGVRGLGFFGDMPPAATLAEARGFVSGTVDEAPGTQEDIYANDNVHLDGVYEMRPRTSSTQGFTVAAQRGWALNNRMRINLVDLRNRMAFYNGPSSSFKHSAVNNSIHLIVYDQDFLLGSTDAFYAGAGSYDPDTPVWINNRITADRRGSGRVYPGHDDRDLETCQSNAYLDVVDDAGASQPGRRYSGQRDSITLAEATGWADAHPELLRRGATVPGLTMQSEGGEPLNVGWTPRRLASSGSSMGTSTADEVLDRLRAGELDDVDFTNVFIPGILRSDGRLKAGLLAAALRS